MFSFNCHGGPVKIGTASVAPKYTDRASSALTRPWQKGSPAYSGPKQAAQIRVNKRKLTSLTGTVQFFCCSFRSMFFFIAIKNCTKAYHIICSLCRSTHLESNTIWFSILWFFCDLLWFFKTDLGGNLTGFGKFRGWYRRFHSLGGYVDQPHSWGGDIDFFRLNFGWKLRWFCPIQNMRKSGVPEILWACAVVLNWPIAKLKRFLLLKRIMSGCQKKSLFSTDFIQLPYIRFR